MLLLLEYAAVFLQVTNFRMTNLEREYGITVCYSVHLLLYCIFYSVHLLLYCIFYSVHLLTVRIYCICYVCYLCRLPSRLVIYNSTSVVRPT